MKDTPRTDKKIFEHPSGYEVVISELAYQLILELTAARAEMHKSIEERREESMKATAARSGLEMWKRCSQKAEQELVTVTEQRDRLAEALEHTMKHMRHSLNCPPRLTEGLHACNCQMEWSYDNATEALQSLNQPKQ